VFINKSGSGVDNVSTVPAAWAKILKLVVGSYRLDFVLTESSILVLGVTSLIIMGFRDCRFTGGPRPITYANEMCEHIAVYAGLQDDEMISVVDKKYDAVCCTEPCKDETDHYLNHRIPGYTFFSSVV
jgi:hypothetical protein